MAKPQKKTNPYLIKIYGTDSELFTRIIPGSEIFNLLEKINGVYVCTDFTTAGKFVIYETFPYMSTKVIFKVLYVYPGKLADLVQYCQPKLF
jgi:hypothetical protein